MKTDLASPRHVVAAALVLLVFGEWLPSTDPPVAAPLPVLLGGGAVGGPEYLPMVTPVSTNGILERPLFNVDRKPIRQSARSHPVISSVLPRLAGILISDVSRRAIFMPDGSYPLTLTEGAILHGYTIQRIMPDCVLLTRAQENTVIRPTYETSPRIIQ